MFTAFVAMLLACSANAQNLYVGGGLKFESTTDETLIAIEPEVGYKINEKYSFGGILGLGTKGEGNSRYTEFVITPYLRQNLFPVGGNVGLFLDYQLSYKSAGIKDNKTNTFRLGVAPGLSYNVNKKITVVTHLGFLGYQSSKLDVTGAEAVNKFTISTLSTNVGLSLYYNL